MKIIENIAKWICRKLTRNQVVGIIKVLQDLLNDPKTIFKKPDPELPNYRIFNVDHETPSTNFPDLSPYPHYRRILKENLLKPVSHP